MKKVLGLFFILVIFLGGIWYGRKIFFPKITTYTDVSGYEFKLGSDNTLNDYLTEIGVWKKSGVVLPNRNQITNKIKEIKIVYTDKEQFFYREDGPGFVVGSADIGEENGILTVWLQSNKLLWTQYEKDIDKSWHLQTLFFRIMNKTFRGNNDFDMADYSKYKSKPYFFMLND